MKRDTGSTTPRPPNGETCPAPRTIDLYGRARGDGRPILWKHAMSVVPVAVFERNGRWIRSGHYVIDYNGDAIVVHCGNLSNDNVIVQFMNDELRPLALQREAMESMLLGKVMVSEEQQAAVFEGRRLSDFFPGNQSPCSARPEIANKRTARRKPKSNT